MRDKYEQKIEDGRMKTGRMASRNGEPCGAFVLHGPSGRELFVIADNGMDPDPKLGGWEHVSVSLQGKYPPNWAEMSWVKEQFWTEEETVLQFHPPRSQYVNIHPNCLHLWRNVGLDHPLPPQQLV